MIYQLHDLTFYNTDGSEVSKDSPLLSEVKEELANLQGMLSCKQETIHEVISFYADKIPNLQWGTIIREVESIHQLFLEEMVITA